MASKKQRELIRANANNPAGDISYEIENGMVKTFDEKDSMRTITVTIGCTTVLTIICC